MAASAEHENSLPKDELLTLAGVSANSEVLAPSRERSL